MPQVCGHRLGTPRNTHSAPSTPRACTAPAGATHTPSNFNARWGSALLPKEALVDEGVCHGLDGGAKRAATAQAPLRAPSFRRLLTPRVVSEEEKAKRRAQEEEKQLNIAVSSLRDNLRQLWREKERQLQGMLSGRRNRPPRRSLFDVGDDYGKDEKRLVILNSAPSLTFEKKGFPKLGSTKKIRLGGMNMDYIRNDSDAEYRFARHEKDLSGGRRALPPTVEVFEVNGHTVLGLPSTSTLKQFSKPDDSRNKTQILVAMHNKPKTFHTKGGGGENKSEGEVGSIRGGAAELQQKLFTLRESLAETRGVHNLFNEIPKYNIAI